MRSEGTRADGRGCGLWETRRLRRVVPERPGRVERVLERDDEQDQDHRFSSSAMLVMQLTFTLKAVASSNTVLTFPSVSTSPA